MTVAEAAAVLGISRSAAYALAALWEDTDGQAGLPTVRVGRSRRVPAAGLEKLIGRAFAMPTCRQADRRRS